MSASVNLGADTAVPAERNTRRGMLAGFLGGLAAWVVGGVGRAAPVLAEGENIVVGGEYTTATSVTKLRNQTNSSPVLQAESASNGTAFLARSEQGMAIVASSSATTGVSGQSSSSVGVSGISTGASGIGVSGLGTTGAEGTSTRTGGTGVKGQWIMPAGGGQVPGTGVLGWSGGTGAPPAPKQKTGVYGEANHDTLSRGLHGSSTPGIGVLGQSVTGTGVYAAAPANSGYALQANGRAAFTRTGRTGIAAGQSSRTVAISLLSSASIVLATIQGNVAGIWVRGVSIDVAAGTFTIRLNKAAPSNLTVGWFVLN